MKIYKLADDLGVDKKALLSFAQSKGIEAKSIASELTPEQVDNLLIAFDEAGGVLDVAPEQAVEEEVQLEKEEAVVTSTEEKKVQPEAETPKKIKKKPKREPLPKNGTWLDKIESAPKLSKPPEVVATGRSKAFLVYRVMTVIATLFFVFLGFTAINANRQGAQLTENVNATTKTLTDNQKALDKKIEDLNEEIQTLKDKQAKTEETDKKVENDKKSKSTPKKVEKQTSKK
ncbi:translation initiation factor IF-2 N-terminal domain-containing protein [Lactococcus petauri]